MKAYTIYLNGERGWTDKKIEGFYYEYENVVEEEYTFKTLTENELNGKIKDLNAGESFNIWVGKTNFEIKCEEMDEEAFNNMPEFAGW